MFGLFFRETKKWDIIKETEFQAANTTNFNTQRKLKKLGKGKINYHEETEREDLLKMYSGFDIDTPMGLQHKVCFDLLKGSKEYEEHGKMQHSLFLQMELGGALSSKLVMRRIRTTVLLIMHTIQLGKKDFTKYKVTPFALFQHSKIAFVSLILKSQCCGKGLKQRSIFTLLFVIITIIISSIIRLGSIGHLVFHIYLE